MRKMVSSSLANSGFSPIRRCAIVASAAGVLAATSSANARVYVFTTIDVPGAVSTEARGINNTGQIVGQFIDSTGSHGFLYNNGSFTTIMPPSASAASANGINNRGQIVGSFVDTSGTHGFLESGGAFATINVGTSPTDARGINDTDQIVGIVGSSPSTGAFDLDFSSGGFFVFKPGESAGAYGVNNLRLIEPELVADDTVGFVTDSAGTTHGFVRNSGNLTLIDVRGASETQAFGVNNIGAVGSSTPGEIVGEFRDSSGQHGFLDSGGNFTVLDVPDAGGTEAFGINDASHIVGTFRDKRGFEHGFLATPVVFAGTPGKAKCIGKSVSSLARQYGGLNAAAEALGFPSVRALQNAIMGFCEG